MSILVLIFGLFTGCLLSVLVGFIGRNRNIGFGWAFLISILLTPLIGLIITLISDQRPNHIDKQWGCLGSLFGFIGLIIIALLFLFCFIGLIA